MSGLLDLGAIVSAHARLMPDRIGARDSRRSLTYAQWRERACRLANALTGLGLAKGDRVAILAYNRLEWLEIYIGLAKAGLVAVPVNFRLVADEVRYIVEHSSARAFIVQDELAATADALRGNVDIDDGAWIRIGGSTGGDGAKAGWKSYESLLAAASDGEPGVALKPSDTWALMYTSGTTGRPKGAIRNHHGCAALALVTALDMGFRSDHTALLVMPMCHANSLYFACTFIYLGAQIVIDDRRSFDPEALLSTMASERITFTSLVPTHYIMALGLPDAVKARHDVSRVGKLMISSAPARKDTKLAILEHFRNSELFELYGSSEAGWVTLLRPHEQIEHLGSVGREWTGSGPVRMIDADGNDVPDGTVGELFSLTPYAFDGYIDDPVKTKEAIRADGYVSVGDMARRDERGFIHLVDRKSNMIISGGENVYPSEIEDILGRYPGVRDVAVVGVPHEKWGEVAHAVIVARAGVTLREADVIDWCRDRMAGYKRPRGVSIISEADMPRTATGKIQHRVLRERLGKGVSERCDESPDAQHGPRTSDDPVR